MPTAAAGKCQAMFRVVREHLITNKVFQSHMTTNSECREQTVGTFQATEGNIPSAKKPKLKLASRTEHDLSRRCCCRLQLNCAYSLFSSHHSLTFLCRIYCIFVTF